MENKSLQINFTLPSDLRIGERACRILAIKFEHPEWTAKQIGDAVGVSSRRVSYLLSNQRVLAAMPIIARQRIKSMVPKATRALESLVDQNENLAVKEKAVTRVLADQKVLDAPEIVVRHDITVKSTQELEQMIRSSQVIPPHVIEAEYSEDTTQAELHNKPE